VSGRHAKRAMSPDGEELVEANASHQVLFAFEQPEYHWLRFQSCSIAKGFHSFHLSVAVSKIRLLNNNFIANRIKTTKKSNVYKKNALKRRFFYVH
jgi:hypothetical protein